MPEDFRVATSFRTHRKRKRLRRRLGDAGLVALLDLWAYAAGERPSGELHGLTAEDLAEEADWCGDPDDLLVALAECGFIECDEMGAPVWLLSLEDD